MPLALQWSAQADALLLQLRAAGVPWPDVGRQLGVGRNAAIERGRRLGLEPGQKLRAPPPAPPSERADRPPLPAGHPMSWHTINRDTVLEGISYPFPVYP